MSETTPATRKHSGGKSADRLAVCPILAKAQAQKVIANKRLYWEALFITCFRTKLLPTHIGRLVFRWCEDAAWQFGQILQTPTSEITIKSGSFVGFRIHGMD